MVRRLRRLSNREANREVRWDKLSEVPSGWARVEPSNTIDRTIHYFYEIWQHMGARKPGRRRGEEKRFWGADRPGIKGDYLDDSVTREGEKP